MQALIIFLLILAILLVIFTLQNSIGITINVFFWEIANAPLVLVLLACIILGYILSSAYYLPKIWKLRKERNLLQKRRSGDTRGNSETIIPENDHLNESHEGIELDDDDDDTFFKN